MKIRIEEITCKVLFALIVAAFGSIGLQSSQSLGATDPVPAINQPPAADAKPQSLFTGSVFGINGASGTDNLVKANTLTGAVTVVGQLAGFSGVPSAGISALDASDHKYFIFLDDANGSEHLVTIDAQTGAVLGSPLSAGLLTLQFDPSSRSLFGVARDQVSGNFDLDVVDPDTGELTVVATILGFSGGFSGCPLSGISALSVQRHNYFTLLDDNSGMQRLLTIDTRTGAVIASPASSGALSIEFDPSTGKLLGVAFDQSSHLFDLVVIDPLTGGVSVVASIPGFSSLPSACVSTFDVVRQRYIGILTDANGMARFVNVNTRTGSVLSSPPSPGAFDIEFAARP